MRALMLIALLDGGCLVTTTDGEPQQLGVRYRCEAVDRALVFRTCARLGLPELQHAYPCDCEVACREVAPTEPCLVAASPASPGEEN